MTVFKYIVLAIAILFLLVAMAIIIILAGAMTYDTVRSIIKDIKREEEEQKRRETMESYMRGKIRAFGHKCEECVYYNVLHCDNPNLRGSKSKEIVHGDAKYMEPQMAACVLYRGKEESED